MIKQIFKEMLYDVRFVCKNRSIVFVMYMAMFIISCIMSVFSFAAIIFGIGVVSSWTIAYILIGMVVCWLVTWFFHAWHCVL